MLRRHLMPAAASLALALSLTARAEVTDVAGVKYENSVQLGNAKLQLNGAGIRYKAVFKVYTAGLYLPQKMVTADAVLRANGPRRLHVVMLRDINAEEMGKMFTRGLEQNASREEFSKVIPGVIKLSEVFAARKRLSAGDWFSIDYVPGIGSSLLINGKLATDPIKEPEFFNALMKIWLGNAPADAQLKEALLGKAPAPKDPFN